MSGWGKLITEITRWPTGARLAILAASVYLGLWSDANSTVKMIAVAMSCFVGTLIACQLATRLTLGIKRIAKAMRENRPERRFISLMQKLEGHRKWYSSNNRSSWFGGNDRMTRWNILSGIAQILSELGVSHPPVTYSNKWSGDFDFHDWDRFLEALRVCAANGGLKDAIKESEQFISDMREREKKYAAEAKRMEDDARKREVERIRRAGAAAGGLKG